MAAATDGSPGAAARSGGNVIASRPSRSASSRAWTAFEQYLLFGEELNLGACVGVVERQQDVALVDVIAFVDAQRRDGAAVGVLDALAVALDLDDGVGDDGTVERRGDCPGAEAAEEDEENCEAGDDGAARRIARRWRLAGRRRRRTGG